ncbi:15718_t:CDS:2 [Funneliformis caledonium]|uniref:15718_t:CDS:1 n=1 Tax=Funneliformis caledonium TaxID=1117310 RepID=A0A9N9C871_9GLOM|nr:15718_t:CDS:2 [Funneliformis caledonium]
MSLVYAFNTQNNLWNIQNITGENPIRKDNLKGIMGKILKWEKGSTANAPSSMGAILFSNQLIVYLGGYYATSDNDGMSLSLSQIYYYDTVHDSWITRNFKLTNLNKRIGWATNNNFRRVNNLNNLKPQDALYVLY